MLFSHLLFEVNGPTHNDAVLSEDYRFLLPHNPRLKSRALLKHPRSDSACNIHKKNSHLSVGIGPDLPDALLFLPTKIKD